MRLSPSRSLVCSPKLKYCSPLVSGSRRPHLADKTVVTMTTEKSASQRLIVGVIAFGFLFGAIYPLANNSLRFATADESMSGGATRMRQDEIDQRLKTIPVFVVTDLKNSPYVADGKVPVEYVAIRACVCVV